ncbi:hypothetical protein IAT40_002559 [Kwoniella sp. CBS 6097]
MSGYQYENTPLREWLRGGTAGRSTAAAQHPTVDYAFEEPVRAVAGAPPFNRSDLFGQGSGGSQQSNHNGQTIPPNSSSTHPSLRDQPYGDETAQARRDAVSASRDYDNARPDTSTLDVTSAYQTPGDVSTTTATPVTAPTNPQFTDANEISASESARHSVLSLRDRGGNEVGAYSMTPAGGFVIRVDYTVAPRPSD